MPSVTKVNGFLNKFVTGTVFQNANLGFYQVTLRSTSDTSNTAINLQTQDGDAAGEADQIVELVVKTTNAIAYFAPSAAAGVLSIVVDGSQWDATALATAIETISGVGTDTIVQAADQLDFIA
jgi:ABC-type phosphate transport system substrate-binding protein